MSFIVKLFIDIMNMGITASYVILAVLLIRACLRKVPKRYSYYLWAAVAFRLLCPISFSSVISIFNLKLFHMNTQSSTGAINYIPSEIGTMPRPQLNVGIPAADRLINNSLPVASPTVSVNPMQIMVTVATVLWITGIVALLLYGIISYYRLKKRVSAAVLKQDNIYECDKVLAPFVLDIFKPRVYIPFNLGEEELNYILRHENYHIKRRDHLIKPFSFLLLTVYWFNPLIWIAFYCMGKDMEMSCDEKVLGDMGASIKNAYSLSLLSFAANYRFPTASPLAFGETNTKGRIKNILRFKKTNWWVSVAIIILCVVAIIAFAANPSNQNKGNEVIPASDTVDNSEISDLARQLYDHKNPYIGDAPADGTLLQILGVQDNIGSYTIELETDKKPYILRIVYSDEVSNLNMNTMIDNAIVLLALIDNADQIQWNYPHSNDNKLTRNTLSIFSFGEIKSYSDSATKVQELLNKIENNHQELSSDYDTANYDGMVAAEYILNPDLTLSPVNDTSDSDIGNNTGSDNGLNNGITASDSITPVSGKTLTMEDILAGMDWGSLTYDDFKAYDNAVMYELDDTAALNTYIMFELTYDGKPYELQVSYMKNNNSIDAITLLKKTDNDMILLYSPNPLYKVDTDVYSFINKNFKMSDYLTYTLPDGFNNGPYTATLWGGGNYIFKDGEQPVGPKSESAPLEWYAPGTVMRIPYNKNETDPTAPKHVVFENGKLTNGLIDDNHSWDIGNPIILNGVEEQAVMKEEGHDLYTAAEAEEVRVSGTPIPEEDLTSTMWEIYFAKEDGNAAYVFFLNEKNFTKEDAIAIAQSVHFTDAAFE